MPTFGARHLSTITPKDVRDWHAGALADRPTMRSHAYSLLRTIMASAVTDEMLDANPCRITGAGRASRVHKIRPASVDELAAQDRRRSGPNVRRHWPFACATCAKQ